ncbi:hypothetical protein [Mycoplasma marinum]|uniref:Uncharacterized protein n=2 Tax=Mycoplasma marinum TaxID=1937190 RepID=A0A4R0XJ40_9MOLU|nr:hypothetical protein [Mycoplasma marinum]TCG10623.1 hypothetical protein C4B24_04370 [Mycoplasma marinum]
MLNQPQTNNGYPQPTVITNLDLYTFDYNNKNSSISTIKNVIFKDWVADTNYQKNLEDTKQKFKKNVESFLELQRLNFRKVNSFLSSEHKDFRNFKWDLNEMINILNDKTGYTKIEKAKLVKLCGVAMMDFLYNPQGKKDFLVNIQNNIKDANIQTKIKDDLQTSKIEFDEVISILNNPSKMIEKQANKVLKEFNKSIERDRISSTSLENPIELVKEVKEVFENVIEIAKEMNKMLSLVSAATGPLGKTVLLAFSVALDVLSAIVGEEVIDGFKFEYGNAKSIIWTGGQHTEHKFWGIKFPDTNVTDVDDLDLIKPIEVTNNYEKDFMFFEGKKYNNENNLISAWLDKIASMNTEDIPQNIKDKLNLQYSFNGKNASDISKLSKDVINNAVPQEFLEINGSLVSDLKTKKDFEVDKILNDIKPIWVAQLPKTTIDKNGVQHLENIPYKMPITNKVKLFGNPNEISNNDYLMIDANKKDAKLLSLEKVIDVFGKLFERKYMQMESKQISEYEALFTDDFDKQSNGFSEKTIYKAKSVGGEIEIFLDLNDAINWLLVHSNYSTIENHGEKVIYTYKGNDYLSVTDFINDLLSKQVKGGKQNANKIYKK